MPTNDSEPAAQPPAAAVAPGTPPPAANQLTGDDLGPPPAIAFAQLGGYRIVGKLGEGGMGVVYQAVQLSLDRTVALKVIKGAFTSDRPFVARFLREARVAARIDHANVVAIYDTGEADGHLFTAQQFVPGGDLQQRLRTGGAFSEDEALRIAAECGRGLRAIHLAGLIHRDIKPSNIFIAGDGSVKIGDLGLVRSVLDDERLTYSGDLVGTPAYMSPEQALAESDVDARTDLYALGASLYHLLTGQPPFGGKSPFLIGHQVLAEMAPDPRAHNPALSAETCAIVHHAMRKERSLRYQTADEMVEDLTRVRARAPLRYARVAEMAAERRATLGAALAQGAASSRRRLGPAVLALVVVLSVACALAIGLRLASGPQPLPPPVLPVEQGFPVPQPAPAPESVAALPELILDHDGATQAAGEELARREAAAAPPGGSAARGDDAARTRSRPQLLPAPAAPPVPVAAAPSRPAGADVPVSEPASAPAAAPAQAAGAPPRPAAQPAAAADTGAPSPPPALPVLPVLPVVRIAPAAPNEPSEQAAAPAERSAPAPPLDAVQAAPARARAGVPAWASRSGSDRFGPWVEIDVQASKQRFRRCPGGIFQLGSPDDEEGREAGEGLHKVTLAHAFWLADTECTQLMWSSVMGSNPSSTLGPELPVDQVSWQACQEFCQRLGARALGAHARLPSEAEWEAACRAGSRGPFSGGAEPSTVAWYQANSGAAMHLVATRQANILGLYDCQGNVWEWCQECDPGYPDHAQVAGELVLRGGAWSSAQRACRAAQRNLRPDGDGFLGAGLRVVLDDQ